ncbi:uncharacterized protein METZ01_LOCUS220157 [marine metagenome]|uniref:Uncharacterized protein n=1 Tax=marine metagenome TaxID=408172 RepID=A0A382FYF3_9ZZZZ
MDPIFHTVLAVGSIWCAYCAGQYFGSRLKFDQIISTTLDKLEHDGYLAVKTDKDGEKDLILISAIVAKALRDARSKI